MDVTADERRELGAQFVPLSRALIAAETPLLEAHGISMWEYVILNALVVGGAPTQLELARTTGRDKTRLITNLDSLEAATLVLRRPDPDDRRARIVEITSTGRTVVDGCRTDIRAMEDALLAGIPPTDRETFHRVLRSLATAALH